MSANFYASIVVACASVLVFGGCATKTVSNEAPPVAASASNSAAAPKIQKAAAGGPSGPLICKARKSKFRFDWEAASPSSSDGRIDQNSVSFDFRAADRPAGTKGENLKIGECGWASAPMTTLKKEKSKVSYKRLSDEATETFYKLRTGKVFKVPVRQGKNGLNVEPGAPVTVIR